jgi:(p)ppGpp synthase/HD superfamily hydrolase
MSPERSQPSRIKTEFRESLNGWFSEKDTRQIMRSWTLASRAHFGQFRKVTGEPFFVHPLSVVNELLAAGIKDADVICGAFLHDTAEDTALFGYKKTMGYMEYIENVWEYVSEQFNLEVAEIMVSLTEPPSIDEEKDGIVADNKNFFTKAQAKEKQVDLLMHASPKAAIIKLGDRLHNSKTFYSDDEHPTPEKKIAETRKLVPMLAEIAAQDYPEATEILVNQIYAALEKMEADWHLLPRGSNS